MRDDSVEMSGEAEAAVEQHGEAAPQEEAHHHIEIRDKPDGESDPLGEAGWYLEHERLMRGLSLEDAAEGCGIHPYHIEAIEYGDMTCLPERGEALEMIGAYTAYLGFDPEPLVQHFAQFMPVPEFTADVRHPANPGPLSSARILSFASFAKLPRMKLRRIPGGAGGLVAGLAGAVLLFGAVSYMLMPHAGKAPDKVADMSGVDYPALPPPPGADLMPTASTGSGTADVSVGDEPMPAEETQTAAAQPEGRNDLDGTGLDGITALIQKNVPQTTASTSPAPGAAPKAAGTQQFGEANAGSRLTLKAKAPVWVRIEDANGNVVMTQMLMKGDTYRVPNRDGLVVIARDGGLLDYIIDGKEKGILGTPGEILVGRSLDLKSFES
ncbi:helix-turn-helix domain-containing protein [Aestuariivirga sp.]|uniref:helix-turn-helix domain-containing protein n=1 Tax=Aestuariivirga sp. TaxID=2650926 RepID=UPI0025C19F9D|nr:helix-turn-helix domain-containing protein [Aestuariivirga sp.]MCA3555251.1 helix-turn-helix domain-containing protein [Aestuariivirga sp.]